MRRLGFLGLAIALAAALPARASDESTLSPEEREVLGVAIAATRNVAMASWVLVADRTSTFSCSLTASELIQLGECSGMRASGETPEQVVARLRASIHGIGDAELADLQRKSDASVAVGKPLAFAAKQFLWGPAAANPVPPELGSPTMALAVSRVGFDAARTRAIAYVATLHWTDRRGSFGEYIHLTKSEAGWAIAGRAQAWRLHEVPSLKQR